MKLFEQLSSLIGKTHTFPATPNGHIVGDYIHQQIDEQLQGIPNYYPTQADYLAGGNHTPLIQEFFANQLKSKQKKVKQDDLADAVYLHDEKVFLLNCKGHKNGSRAGNTVTEKRIHDLNELYKKYEDYSVVPYYIICGYDKNNPNEIRITSICEMSLYEVPWRGHPSKRNKQGRELLCINPSASNQIQVPFLSIKEQEKFLGTTKEWMAIHFKNAKKNYRNKLQNKLDKVDWEIDKM